LNTKLTGGNAAQRNCHPLQQRFVRQPSSSLNEADDRRTTAMAL
jgi:hypothetical protein